VSPAPRRFLLLLPGAALAGLAALPPRGETAPAPKSPPAPAHKSYVETIPGSKVKFEMVAVRAGVFFQGSPEKEPGRARDEGPQHRVRVGAYWIGKTEVTWDEFDLYRSGKLHKQEKAAAARARLDDADAVTRPSGPYIDAYRGFGTSGYPVVGVSHHFAMEYCRWLSLLTGRAYRLPTEAEWEHACRAGSGAAYSWGDDPARLKEHGWYEDNSGDATHPAGKKKPNRWGLHDMHGNVAEWCLDRHDERVYQRRALLPLSLRPVSLPAAERYPHVARGGSWCDAARACRSAARRASHRSWNRSDPGKPQSVWWLADADFVGFRVARAVEEQPELRGLRSRVTSKSE
jgi:formylglycine-generating enzyme required for sulfatase activity